MFLFTPVAEGYGSKEEVFRRWSIDDVMDANEVIEGKRRAQSKFWQSLGSAIGGR